MYQPVVRGFDTVPTNSIGGATDNGVAEHAATASDNVTTAARALTLLLTNAEGLPRPEARECEN